MDFNLLTTVLTTFVNALSAGQERVQSAGGGILKGLAIIEIVLAGLWLAMDNASLATPLKKLLQLSFWFWFATNFTSVAKVFVDSLVQLGLSAGGQPGNMSLLLDPSRIAGMGLESTAPLLANLHDAGITQLSSVIVLGFCYMIIMACFFIMACQVCLAVVEYYLVLTLATCLIPFGISPHTKFLSEKAIGAVVAVSVKLMVLSFIISLVSPVLGQIRFGGAGGELKLNEILSMVLVCSLLAVVVWRAPAMASDLLAASPSLSAGAVGQQVSNVVSSGARMVGGAVAGGLAAASVVGRAAAAGGGTLRSALKTVGSGIVAGAKGASAPGTSLPASLVGGPGPASSSNASSPGKSSPRNSVSV
jgi:type IV secretion system protein TrbL